MFLNNNRLLWCICIAFLFFGREGVALDDIQLPGAVHVHTRFSSGKYTIEELVVMAKQKGIDVLVLTDHDLVAMEYGLFPFRNIIKKRKERKSILKLGPEQYLASIRKINSDQNDVLVIPGAQSSPFYYWTGSFFNKNLTANDYRKELLLVGMDDPEDYRNLPLLHRGFSTRYLKNRLPRVLLLLGAFIVAVYLIFQKGVFRASGVLIGLLSVAFIIDANPFRSSRFDPYHGTQGIAPYQELIDYVRARNGLVFWAHPESTYSKNGKQLGPISLMTKPYPDALIESVNYTGFSALYGDWITATAPGNHWDQALSAYCNGSRAHPVWGIAGLDFHQGKNGGGVVDLDTFQTVFLVQDKTAKAVLKALATGKTYAVRKGRNSRLLLEQFQITDKNGIVVAKMGDDVKVAGPVTVQGKITSSDKGGHPMEMALIKGGKPVHSFTGPCPLVFRFVDNEGRIGKTFFRLTARGKETGTLLSNPIFVEVVSER